MENEFVSYEQAVALKELGFDGYTFYMFDGTKLKNLYQQFYSHDAPILAPLKQQVFRWFREKYNLLGGVYSNASGWLWEIHDNVGGTRRLGCGLRGDCEYSGTFTSFEKAENACIDKLIELAKQQNK